MLRIVTKSLIWHLIFDTSVQVRDIFEKYPKSNFEGIELVAVLISLYVIPSLVFTTDAIFDDVIMSAVAKKIS